MTTERKHTIETLTARYAAANTDPNPKRHTPFTLLYANAQGLTVRDLALLLGSGWSQSTVRRHARSWLAGGYVRKVGARFVITARGIVMRLRHTRLTGYVPPVLRRANLVFRGWPCVPWGYAVACTRPTRAWIAKQVRRVDGVPGMPRPRGALQWCGVPDTWVEPMYGGCANECTPAALTCVVARCVQEDES